jgi:hypothetical protein
MARWNTWCVDGNCARDYCTAQEVKAMADVIVKEGMRDLGWTYINLGAPPAPPAGADQCWHLFGASVLVCSRPAPRRRSAAMAARIADDCWGWNRTKDGQYQADPATGGRGII